MKTEDLIREYLPTVSVMQLATSKDNQPWACNLHYYSDDTLNIYWLSKLDTRHSQDLESNAKAAIVVKVHEDKKDEDYIIGLSLEGEAELLDQKQYSIIADGFAKKHGTSEKFMSTVRDGTNPHKFYKFIPTKVVLFDTKNFPDRPRQEWATS